MGTTGRGREGAPRRKRVDAGERTHAVARVRKSITLTVLTARRLGHHAVETGRTESAIVEDLVAAHVGRYVVYDRGGAGTAVDAAAGQGGGGADSP